MEVFRDSAPGKPTRDSNTSNCVSDKCTVDA